MPCGYLDVDPEGGCEYGGGGEGHEGGGQQQEAGRGHQGAATRARGAGGQGVEEAGADPPHGQQVQGQQHQHGSVPVAQRPVHLRTRVNDLSKFI